MVSEVESLAAIRLADDDQPGAANSSTGYYAYREFNPATPEVAFTPVNTPWLSTSSQVEGTFAGDYRFIEPSSSATATAAAEWTFNQLPVGNYEVWVTWPAHENRASNAPYTISATSQSDDQFSFTVKHSVVVNQKFAPAGEVFAGVSWQRLTLTDGVHVARSAGATTGTLKVTLTNSANGLVAADGVRLVRIDSDSAVTSTGNTLLDGLQFVDLRGNPLNNIGNDAIVPTLTSSVSTTLNDSTISGRVWLDADADGLQDSVETGALGATVELFSSADGRIGNTDDRSLGVQITDAAGYYRFDGLALGKNYYIVTRTPAGFTFAPVSIGNDRFIDSDVTPSGTTSMLTFAVGQRQFEIDAGLIGNSPRFGFALGIGGSSLDYGNSLALDAAGNVYVTGGFRETVDFDRGPGTYSLTMAELTMLL